MSDEQGDHVEQSQASRTADADASDLTVIIRHAVGIVASQAASPSASLAVRDQVVVGDIPRQPPGFQPPTDLLAELDQAGAGLPKVHVLTGMQGVGKTQLAAGYARQQLEAGWQLVAWVNAENIGTLLADLAAVADAAGLSEGGMRQDATAAGRAVRHRLEVSGDRCLLVFDDATDPGDLRP